MPRRKPVPALGSLCLQSLAQHMQSVWVKDYSENYLDEYQFRYIMGPFNDLAGSLVQDLIRLLGESRRLTRAALHLLLVPHLQELSLRSCPSLVSNAIGQLVTVRCKSLSALDLHGCSRLSADVLVDLVEELPLLSRLGLAETQANVQVLSAVGSCCRRLRELDVSRCKKVSPRALRHLAYDPLERALCCPALRVLLARGLEPAGDGGMVAALAFLLLALPRLEVLAHSAVPDALCLLHAQQLGGGGDADGFPSLQELLAQRQNGSRLTLPLRQLEEVEEPILGTACATCPEAEEVGVWLGDGAAAGWDTLHWGRLARLSLSCAGPRGRALGEVLPLAHSLGPQLQSLALHGFCYEDELSLGALLCSCPNLRAFSTELQAPPGARPDEEPPDEPPRWDTGLLPHAFPRLQRFSLSLAGTASPLPVPHGLVLRATLASLLCRSPRLQSLSLLGIPFSLDSVFETVLAAPGPPLLELRELSLVESQVSSQTVQLLLASDGHLCRLDLSRCRDIYRRDYDGFLQAVRKQRLDLDIIWE
uniref:F-box and leucine rich repeat protein 6 n=1 Tax=Anser brachyrhynchus TaxID=132585 RepID=A0A8B9C7Z2_9AVES